MTKRKVVAYANLYREDRPPLSEISPYSLGALWKSRKEAEASKTFLNERTHLGVIRVEFEVDD